jgi:hypothetical protein
MDLILTRRSLSLPPNTGHCAIDANTSPQPHIRRVDLLAGGLVWNTKRAGEVPINFHCLGSLSWGLLVLQLEAAAATLPKVVLRLLAECVMTPLLTLHSDAGTPHLFAAAATNISRAAAPPFAHVVLRVPNLRLPPVDIEPKMRLR